MTKTILVVDDEPSIMRSLTFVLRRAGFEVLEAHDGDQALETIRGEKPDLVFLDVMMPKRNGYEVLQALRDTGEFGVSRVVMLTAKGQESDRERGIAMGVDAYMTKPFSPLRIVEKAREILGDPVAPAP